jgi:hypothetical protein
VVLAVIWWVGGRGTKWCFFYAVSTRASMPAFWLHPASPLAPWGLGAASERRMGKQPLPSENGLGRGGLVGENFCLVPPKPFGGF